MMDSREGVYGEWEWNMHRKAWERVIYARIHLCLGEPGFTASYDDVWIEGIFPTFEEAERAALGVQANSGEMV